MESWKDRENTAKRPWKTGVHPLQKRCVSFTFPFSEDGSLVIWHPQDLILWTSDNYTITTCHGHLIDLLVIENSFGGGQVKTWVPNPLNWWVGSIIGMCFHSWRVDDVCHICSIGCHVQCTTCARWNWRFSLVFSPLAEVFCKRCLLLWVWGGVGASKTIHVCAQALGVLWQVQRFSTTDMRYLSWTSLGVRYLDKIPIFSTTETR